MNVESICCKFYLFPQAVRWRPVIEKDVHADRRFVSISADWLVFGIDFEIEKSILKKTKKTKVKKSKSKTLKN